jgi:hypothetical protein
MTFRVPASEVLVDHLARSGHGCLCKKQCYQKICMPLETSLSVNKLHVIEKWGFAPSPAPCWKVLRHGTCGARVISRCQVRILCFCIHPPGSNTSLAKPLGSLFRRYRILYFQKVILCFSIWWADWCPLWVSVGHTVAWKWGLFEKEWWGYLGPACAQPVLVMVCN